MTTSPSPKLKWTIELTLKATRAPSTPSEIPHSSSRFSAFNRLLSLHASATKMAITAK